MSDLSAPWKIADLSSSVGTAGLLLSVLCTNGKEKKVGVGWWGVGVMKCDLSDFWTNWALEEVGILCRNMFSNEERIIPQTARMTVVHYVLGVEHFYRLRLELNYPFL